MKSSILRWTILGCFVTLLLLPSMTAMASDCPPSDLTFSDCAAAASTARSPLVPIAGAVAGGIVGSVASGVLSGRNASGMTKEKPKEEDGDKSSRVDPCQADLDRYNEASIRARTLQAGLDGLRNLLTMLETEWENTREASYWSTGLDVAFMAGSLWTKPAAGLLGKELLEQTLGEKLREAALKTFGQELTKGLFTSMSQHGIDWADISMNKPLGSAKQTALQESLTEYIVIQQMKRYASQGIDPKGPVGQALQRNVSSEVAGPLVEGFFGLLSLRSLKNDVFDAGDKLKAIREQMSKVRANLFDAETAFNDAISDMKMARRTLQHCRKLWAQ